MRQRYRGWAGYRTFIDHPITAPDHSDTSSPMGRLNRGAKSRRCDLTIEGDRPLRPQIGFAERQSTFGRRGYLRHHVTAGVGDTGPLRHQTAQFIDSAVGPLWRSVGVDRTRSVERIRMGQSNETTSQTSAAPCPALLASGGGSLGVETPSGRIAYMRTGTGSVALFVHGVLLNKHLWRHQLSGLSDIRRCIAVDLLAHSGTTVTADQDVSVTANAVMLVQFLDAPGIDQVDVVGNDSGGGIAQIFAALNPERAMNSKPRSSIARASAVDPIPSSVTKVAIRIQRSPGAVGGVAIAPASTSILKRGPAHRKALI